MKYVLTDDTIVFKGLPLYRIRALKDIPRFSVKAGDLGGYVESENNLSHNGDAWVFGNARVYGNARVFGDARVSGNAWVFGDARVSGNAWVSGNAEVFGDTRVSGVADIRSKVSKTSEYCVFHLAGHSVTMTKDLIVAGCQANTYKEWMNADLSEYWVNDQEEVKRTLKDVRRAFRDLNKHLFKSFLGFLYE